LNGDSEKALRELNELARNGKDLARLLSDLLNYFRNLLLFIVSKGDKSLMEVSEAEAASIAEQANSVSSEILTRIMDILSDAETRLRDAASKKILVEVSLLKAIDARKTVSLDAVLKQLQQLRAGGSSSGGGAPMTSPAPVAARLAETKPITKAAPISAPVKNESVAAEPAPVTPAATLPANLSELWPKLIEGVAKVSPFIKTYLLEAHPVSLEKNLLTIGYDPEFADHLPLIDNSRNHLLISTKLQELGLGHCQVKFIKHDEPEGWMRPQIAEPAPAPAPIPPASGAATAKNAGEAVAAKKPAPSISMSKEDFKNDPLIAKALEIFKGQIVDVRA
jgi:DNA polymerase-3 subunit gamma/tau